MNDGERVDVELRPWDDDDLPLLERLLGDPAMTEHLGGPETPQKLRERHERYTRNEFAGGTFVVLFGPDAVAAGWVGYWEMEWQDDAVWEAGWSVLPEFQGRGIATSATALVAERARAEKTHRFLHAFPSVGNGPSNAICRHAGFILLGEVDVEYPRGSQMRSNDWRLDLFAGAAESPRV